MALTLRDPQLIESGTPVGQWDDNGLRGYVNKRDAEIAELIERVLALEEATPDISANYPIGTVYINASSNTNPAELLGFGTWEFLGKGVTLVNVDDTDPELNTHGLTVGEKEHTLTVDEMPEHTHVQNSHNHTQNSHNHTQNSHNHTQNSHGHSTQDHKHGLTAGWGDAGPGFDSLRYQNWGANNNSPNHSELMANANVTVNATTATNQATTATNQATTATNNAATAVNQNAGGGLAHNNMQLSYTVYMWKRTA